MFSKSKRFAAAATATPAPGAYNVCKSVQKKGMPFERSERFKAQKEVYESLNKTKSQEILNVSTTSSVVSVSSSCSDLTTKTSVRMEKEISRVRKENRKLSQDLAKLNIKIEELEIERMKSEGDRLNQLEKEKNLENEISRLQDEKALLEEQNRKDIENLEKELTESLRSLSFKYESLEDAHKNVMKEKAECETLLKREIKIIQDSYESCKQDVTTMHSTYENLKKQHDDLLSQNRELQKQLQETQEEIQMLRSQYDVVCRTKEQLEMDKEETTRSFQEEKIELLKLNQEMEEQIALVFAECADLKEHISSLKETEADLNSQLNELQRVKEETVGREAKIKEEFAKRILEAQAKVTTLEEELQKPTSNNTEIEELKREVASWQSKYEALVTRMRPFQAQLDAFEDEKEMLLRANVVKDGEIASLADKYVKILGHQNNKQKIKHVMKLKEENLQMKKELLELRSKERKDSQKIHDLELKLVRSGAVKTLDVSQAFQSTSDKENIPRRVLKDSAIVN